MKEIRTNSGRLVGMYGICQGRIVLEIQKGNSGIRYFIGFDGVRAEEFRAA